MSFGKSNSNISNLIFWKKLKKRSNGSNNIVLLKWRYSLQYKIKSLLVKKKWSAGRCKNTGRITVFSKGSRAKNKLALINYSFRENVLYFVGGLNMSGSFRTKMISILFTSSGSIFFKPLNVVDDLFLLTRLKSIFSVKNSLSNKVILLKPFLHISETPFMLLQQEKNSPISLLELNLTKGVEYVRSVGSNSKLVKLDTRVGYGLVVLPSALKKVFSIFSLASNGSSNLNIAKNILISNKSGDNRKKGFKSKVRGVAMNPVDHPHGGRTNSIRFPRTPWGKVAKYK